MPNQLPSLPHAVLEQLARRLGDATTGSQISDLLRHVGLEDPLGYGATKWRRIHEAFEADQVKYGCANRTLLFTKTVLSPARFVGAHDVFERLRQSVNECLAFAGYYIHEDGRLSEVKAARTLPEAQKRASQLRAALVARRVHPDVLRFCGAELVVPNYFHAVFEATKSVADKLRSRTGLASDGADLVDAALGMGKATGGLPILAFNTLQTETERSEHKGLAMLLKGMFGAFRNVTAHAPKVTWPIEEQDALDLLTLASFLHRRLDSSVTTIPKESR